MEKQIREYEKFIAQKVAQEMSEAERMKLADLHRETVANFQHERIIHLMVTLFFALYAVLTVFVSMWVYLGYGFQVEMLPLFIMALILVVLTGFYVRHYYFLENHIQGLYKYTKKLRIGK